MKKQRISKLALSLLVVTCTACSLNGTPASEGSLSRRATTKPAPLMAAASSELAAVEDDEPAGVVDEAHASTETEDRREDRPVPAEVARFLELFSGSRRDVIREHAELSKGVQSMIEKILNEQGLPREIMTIAFLESRFNPSVSSRRGDTVGMWQLARSTAREYGLVVNRKTDERKDPLKATTAAAKMLSELRDRFGNWALALAAYNSGPFRVRQAIRDSGGETSVFALAARGHLSQTTSDYLARFAALTMILGDPTRYGFAPNPAS